MKKLNKNNPATLSKWLVIATRGLATPGKKRIVREIEAHYAEAIQARVAQGERLQTAEAGAIADLGDPILAAKRFRRSHFTTLEAKCISNLSGQKGEIISLVLGYLPYVILLLLALLVVTSKLLLFVITLFFAQIICPTISFFILRRPASKTRTLSLLRLSWVYGLATDFVLLLICLLAPDQSSFVVAIPIVLSPFQIIPMFLTWNKARKMTDKFDETTGIAS